MNKDILDIYNWQLLNLMDSGQKIFYDEFLEEYVKIYYHINLVQIDKESLQKDISLNLQAYVDLKENIYFLADRMEKRINKCNEQLKEIFHFETIRPIFFIGDGSVDGHGIKVHNEVFVIFDLTSILHLESLYHMDLFILHELIHPLHFRFRDFYYSRYKSVEEMYFKRLYTEGLATYLSWQSTFATLEDAFWLGFLPKVKVEKWEVNCIQKRANIGLRLNKSIKLDRFSQKLYFELFSINTIKDYKIGRLGYFYGFEIVKIMANSRSLDKLFSVDYEIVRTYIIDYFNI